MTTPQRRMDCCFYPTRCCTMKYTEPTKPDECRCGRGACNGIVQVILAQLFMFLGLVLSGMVVADCNLVHTEEPILTRADNVTTTTFGLLSYKDPDTGGCYYWSIQELVVGGSVDVFEGSPITGIYTQAVWTAEQQREYYIETVLGEDWYKSRGLIVATFGLSVACFLYGISFFCSTQVKPARCFMGFVVAILLPVLMGLGIMSVFMNDWCDAEGCSMGRTSYYAFAAVAVFFISGMNYWLMEAWPGQTVIDDLELDEDERGWESEKPRENDPYEKKSRKSRKFSGDAWVIEVEKNKGNTDEDFAPTSRSSSYNNSGPMTSSTSSRAKSDRYTDEPGSPTPRSSTNRRSSRAKRPSRDPSGQFDGKRGFSDHIENHANGKRGPSTHIEQHIPTPDE